jgi:hypothetical protein
VNTIGDSVLILDPQLLTVVSFDPSDRNFNLFPNPAIHEITISGLENNSAIRIFNCESQCIRSTVSENAIKTIDINDLPEGFYLIEVSDSIQTRVFKFVKRN